MGHRTAGPGVGREQAVLAGLIYNRRRMMSHLVARGLRAARLIVLALVGLTAVAPTAVARADRFGLIAGGDEAKQPVVETELGPWLKAAGHDDVRIGTKALDGKQVTQVVNCFILADQACASAAVASGKLDGLLFVMVEVERDPGASGDRIKITGWLYGGDGAPIAAQSLFCNDCRNDTLTPKLAELARLLFAAAQSGAGRLAVTTQPAGATVLVDGASIGVTPITTGLREGPHTITVERTGYVTLTRPITIKNDGETRLDVELAPLGGGGGGGGKGLAYGALALGGAAIVGGAILMFVVDEDPVTTPTKDPTYTEATLPGAVTLGAGVAVAAVGGYLFHRAGAKPRAATPMARATGDGAVIGITGRF